MDDVIAEFTKLKAEILDFLSDIDRSKYTYIQNYIYFAHYPIFSFTESVIILCDKGKPKVAKVLLRTLFEVHIDVIYHQLGNSKQRLALSARRVFDERVTVLREILSLTEKYQNLESQDPSNLFSRSYLKDAIALQEERRDSVVRGNPGLERVRKVYLKEKAEACDDGSVKNAENGHFGRMYSLIYRQLSPVSHLNGEGLEEFMGEDAEGKIIFSDEDSGDFIVGQAIGICIAFTKDLYDNSLLSGPPLELIEKIEKKLEQFEP
jgi:hypothetical protein